MVPKWLYKLMVEDRTNSKMSHDEHGRPLEDEVDIGLKGEPLASPGFGEISLNLSPENNQFNKESLAYAEKQREIYSKPVCNVSPETNEWNKACLDYVKE